MRPRIVFAYRYASPGGPVTQLLARLELFASHFDVRMLFEWDLGGVSLFPPDVVTVTVPRPAAAFEETVMVMGRSVAVPPGSIAPLTPAPKLTETEIPRFVPWRNRASCDRSQSPPLCTLSREVTYRPSSHVP